MTLPSERMESERRENFGDIAIITLFFNRKGCRDRSHTTRKEGVGGGGEEWEYHFTPARGSGKWDPLITRIPEAQW